jgi:hypothetical protein
MNLFARQRNSAPSRASRAGAKLTWASRTLSGTLSQTRLFLKRQLWAWPIIALVLLSALGWGVRRSIEHTMKENLQADLETLLQVQTAMLETWLRTQESNVQSMANDGETRALVNRLVSGAKSDAAQEGVNSAHEQLADNLAPSITSHGYVGYIVTDRQKIIRAASEAELIGRQEPPRYDDFIV